MAVVLAVPLAELGFALLKAGLVVLAGLAVYATAEEVINNTDLPAKARVWVSNNVAMFNENAKRKERREPTPATCPRLFEWKSVEGKKVAEGKKTGEIWELDYLHGDHFEVYSNGRAFRAGTRTRAVWLDGRQKAL